MERRITFWFHPEKNRMVSIEEVDSGLQADLVCPKCKINLIARKWEKNMYHFAHANGADCIWAYESAIHQLAKEIIEEEKQIYLPDYFDQYEWKKLQFDDVKIEELCWSFRPDAIWFKGGRELWIEFANTHFVDDTKKQYIINNQIACIEVDIRKQDMDTLRIFLVQSSSNRTWINNPILESKIGKEKIFLNLSQKNTKKVTKFIKRRIYKDQIYWYCLYYKKDIYICFLEIWLDFSKHQDFLKKWWKKDVSEIGFINSKEYNSMGDICSVTVEISN